MHRTTPERILEALGARGEATCAELIEAMPDLKPGNIRRAVSVMFLNRRIGRMPHKVWTPEGRQATQWTRPEHPRCTLCRGKRKTGKGERHDPARPPKGLWTKPGPGREASLCRALEEEPAGLTRQELSVRTGYSPMLVSCALVALTSKGLVKRGTVDVITGGRKAARWSITAKGREEMT